MHLTYSDQLILSSVRVHPTAADIETLDALIPLIDDWDYLSRTIIERGIGPLFFKKLSLLSNAALIPEVAKSNLQQAYFRTLSRSMVLYDAFRKVADAFTVNHIQVVALKGIHLAEWLYGDIGLRQFSDIDLLVTPEDGERCLQILIALGFRQSGDEVSNTIMEYSGIVHYPPMVRNDVSVEIHINLHRRQKPYNLDAGKIIENSEPMVLNQSQVQVPELHDLLIFLCIHLDKHFTQGDIQFTSFNDITNLIDLHGEEIDWEKCISRCREFNCESVVFKYLLLVNRFFNISLPDYILQKYASTIGEQEEQIFIRYLNGYTSHPYGASTHLKNIAEMHSTSERIRYLLKVVFPSREFMARSYAMKHPSLFWLYYPTRHWTALKGVWKMIAP
ncbi:MAG: hypothetical protein EOM44_13270 [Bacteroidia bacterium]|nr:hypothetical protein [Bacteroidia bacterium]